MATTFTMRLANFAHKLTSLSLLPSAEVTYDPTASGMTATNVQDAIDELEAGGGGGGSQFDEDAPDVTYRFPSGFSKIGAEGGDESTDDAYLAITSVTDAGIEAYTSTISAQLSVSVAASPSFAIVEAGRVRLVVNGSTATSKHDLSGGHGMVVPRLAADPSGGNSEEGQIYFNTTSDTFRGYDGTVWGELALT